ncbi:ATP-binding protein [Sphingomonas cannabina]|uniref:ATP-binding protein n=1 Tax=Sphingomonas cannabina TaxID=2899123 RepID=UPI001F273DC0|nr:ATP-binding protein [Sphingomonas cannabina]UIJ43992.1 ATP-binding protein [Sphingomonas cannabina]
MIAEQTADAMSLAPVETRRDSLWRRALRWLLGKPEERTVQTVAAIAPEPLKRTAAGAGLGSGRPAVNTRLAPVSAAARIIAAFDAAHPVRQRQNLYGRDDKLETLFEAVLVGRQHAIIHGSRGSGKTSLAQVFGDYADQEGAVVIYTACEASTSFADLIRPYLGFIPDSCIPFVEKHGFRIERDALLAGDFGPRMVVDLFSRLTPDCQIILILDEFDRVEDGEVNSQVATLMKLLSDARLPVQMLLVGIAQTVEELILCHPSLRRHLVPIPIGRISRDDTFALITTGAQRAGVTFDEASQGEIADLACGSPYHVQLFCYLAALEAVRRDCAAVDLVITRVAMRRAFDTWALLNPGDAELFQRLAAADLDKRTRIQRAAREAAMRDSLSADEEIEGLLGPALRRDTGRSERAYFRDGAAPQFLLTILALHQGARLKAVSEAGN